MSEALLNPCDVCGDSQEFPPHTRKDCPLVNPRGEHKIACDVFMFKIKWYVLMTRLQLMQTSMTPPQSHLDPDATIIIFFPPDNAVHGKMTSEFQFQFCRELGMGPYWNTLHIEPNSMTGDIYTFNTNRKPITYARLCAIKELS